VSGVEPVGLVLKAGYNVEVGGTQWCSWHRATSREVAGAIPDGETGNVHSHNYSGHTMAFGLTQPLTEMGTRTIS
jgi:hypothetical protein